MVGTSSLLAGTAALSCSELTNVVARAAPFHFTTDEDVNPVPSTVSVIPGPAAGCGGVDAGANGSNICGSWAAQDAAQKSKTSRVLMDYPPFFISLLTLKYGVKLFQHNRSCETLTISVIGTPYSWLASAGASLSSTR